jgi:type VI secretion system protein ImpA
MSKGPLLDVETLVKPIVRTEEHAAKEGYLGGAGDPTLYDHVLRDELEQLRQEEPPPWPGEPPPDTPPKKGDWKKVEAKCKEALTKSKDLRLVGYLTEALIKQYGLAGLRDGLILFRRMCEACWEKMYPDVKEGVDMRLDPLANMFDGGGRGLSIPQAVLTAPLIVTDVKDREKPRYSAQDYEYVQDPKKKAGLEVVTQALPRSDPEYVKNELDAVAAALGERDKLYKHLQTRMGNAGPAPGFTNVRTALEKCQNLAKSVWEKVKPVGPPPEEKSDKPEGGAAPAAGKAGAPAASRAEIYAQLAACANKLKELEPHSPIPYLIERCVKLGRMPFPEMIKDLLRKDDALKDMYSVLDIKDGAPAAAAPAKK